MKPVDKAAWAALIVGVLLLLNQGGGGGVLPVAEGARHLVVIHETEDVTPAVKSVFIALRDGEPSKYLKDKGHLLTILDDDLQSKLNDQLRAELAGMTPPVLFVLDHASGKLIHKTPLPGTADGVLAVVKAHGG